MNNSVHGQAKQWLPWMRDNRAVKINLDQGAAHSNHYTDYPDVNQSRQHSFSVLNNVGFTYVFIMVVQK